MQWWIVFLKKKSKCFEKCFTSNFQAAAAAAHAHAVAQAAAASAALASTSPSATTTATTTTSPNVAASAVSSPGELTTYYLLRVL